MRNVKIEATLDPAPATYDVIKDLFEAGADVFRLHMSHGSHDDIRDLERDMSRPISASSAIIRGRSCAAGCSGPAPSN